MPMSGMAVMAAAGVVFAHGAFAADLPEMQAGNLQLGTVLGTFYYTNTPTGFRVVTTLSQGATVAPVRFVATLRSGESVTVSVPRGAGQSPLEMLIRRDGDHLIYTETAHMHLATD